MGSVQNHAYRGAAGWRYAASPDSATISKSVSLPGSTGAARRVATIFALAGIEIGGRRPWDLQVYDERFYQRLLSNFDRAWPVLQHKYDERFYRMWKYYLLGCAGGFRARKLQLWQIVLSKGDIPAYTSIR